MVHEIPNAQSGPLRNFHEQFQEAEISQFCRSSVPTECDAKIKHTSPGERNRFELLLN